MDESRKAFARSGAFSLVSNSSTLVASVVSFLILARVLEPRDFGTWALFLTVTSLLEMARVGLVQSSFIKFAATADERAWRGLMTSGLVLAALSYAVSIALALALAGFLSRLWREPRLAPLLWDYWPMATTYTPVIMARYVQQVRDDFRGVMVTNMVYRVTFVVAIVVDIALVGTVRLGHLPWLMALAGLVASPVGFLTIRRELRFAPVVNWRQVWDLVRFGRFVFATNLGSMLFSRADLMVLGSYVSSGAIAVYNVPQRIGNYVDVPLTSVATVVYPRAAAIEEDAGHLRWLHEQSIGVMLALLVPVAVVTFFGAPWIVWIAAGRYYAGTTAVDLLRVVAVMSLVRPYSRQFGVTSDAMGTPHTTASNVWQSLAVSVALNLVLVPRYGMFGAIAATSVAATWGTVAGHYIMSRRIHVSVLRPWKYAWQFYGEIWQSMARRPQRSADLVKEGT